MIYRVRWLHCQMVGVLQPRCCYIQHVARDMAKDLPTTKKDGQPIVTIREINLYAVAEIGGLKDPMVAQIWKVYNKSDPEVYSTSWDKNLNSPKQGPSPDSMMRRGHVNFSVTHSTHCKIRPKMEGCSINHCHFGVSGSLCKNKLSFNSESDVAALLILPLPMKHRPCLNTYAFRSHRSSSGFCIEKQVQNTLLITNLRTNSHDRLEEIKLEIMEWRNGNESVWMSAKWRFNRVNGWNNNQENECWSNMNVPVNFWTTFLRTGRTASHFKKVFFSSPSQNLYSLRPCFKKDMESKKKKRKKNFKNQEKKTITSK